MAEVAVSNLLLGEEWLRKAIRLEPANRWALRNLAGTLMKQGRFEESLAFIKQCLDVAPDDTAMMIAYGDSLTELGRSDESDVYYRKAVKAGGPQHLTDLAKARLTEKAEKALRSNADVRPDVVQYMRDALSRFSSMELSEIQNLALELAMLGNKGLNINDPTKKYRIRAWSGEFTGLQLISIMYAAFQQFAPDTDIGINLGKEYRMATAME